MRALAMSIAIAAALVGCGDDEPDPDAGVRGDAASSAGSGAIRDAASGDAAAGSDAAVGVDAAAGSSGGDAGGTNPVAACQSDIGDELSHACSRCVCIICPQAVPPCDATCVRYVSCLAHCEDTVERCAEQCEGDGGGEGMLTPMAPSVSNLAICIGNLCPMECEVPQSL